jgi:two-component system phosphate regulon sensor histidine kinase PhoR
MHQSAKRGEVQRGRVRVVTPLGMRTYQVTATPVPAAWGAGVFGAVMTLRDVTELDQAVQVKTDFVANASHELRTPVAAIRSAA